MRVACVTTCKGRVDHLSQTLPQNIKDRGLNNVVFVVLDYNDDWELAKYIEYNHKADIAAGRLVTYRNEDADRFHMAHAKNQAHRCAMLEGADILVTLDADNLTGPGFISYLVDKFEADPKLSYISPDFSALPPPGQRFNANNPVSLGRGFAGRLAIRTQDFIKAGGYNEIFHTWRGEDIDLIARLKRFGFKSAAMERKFLNAIAHSSKVRFREYPEAERFENDDIYSITENAHDTVVNNGKFGCGIVYRNFDTKSMECSAIQLNPLPTRVFGIGFQRTGTTSLHEAFQLLGFDSAHWKSADWAKAIWWGMNKWGRSRTLEKDYALCDNPIPILYEQLDKAYPGSKFILTVRKEEAWLKSIETLLTYDGNPQRWTWDGDGFSHKMIGILYGTTEFNRDIFLERYRKHNANVMAYFKGRSDFMRLEIDENTSMIELCKFLDRPIIDMPFPHSHKSIDGTASLTPVGAPHELSSLQRAKVAKMLEADVDAAIRTLAPVKTKPSMWKRIIAWFKRMLIVVLSIDD